MKNRIKKLVNAFERFMEDSERKMEREGLRGPVQDRRRRRRPRRPSRDPDRPRPDEHGQRRKRGRGDQFTAGTGDDVQAGLDIAGDLDVNLLAIDEQDDKAGDRLW